MNNKKEKQGLIQILVAFSLAGSSVVAGKLLSNSVSAEVTVGLSLIFALVVLMPFQIKRKDELKEINRRELLLMVMQALSGIVLTRFFTLWGLKYISAFNAGIINSTTPAVMALMAVIFFKERLYKNHYTGLCFTFTGVLIINFRIEGTFSFSGTLLILAAVLGEVFMTMFRKKSRLTISSVTNTTLLFIISLIIYLPFLYLKRTEFSQIPVMDWIIIVYYGVAGSALAYILWGAGVLKVSGVKAGAATAMIPVSIIFLSFLTGEKFTLLQGCGAVLAITGMVLCNKKEKVAGDESETYLKSAAI